MQVSRVLITASPNGTLIYRTSNVNEGWNVHDIQRANLSSDSLNDPREIMVFPLSMPGPGGEVTELAVIPIVR